MVKNEHCFIFIFEALMFYADIFLREWIAWLYLFGKHGTKVAKMQR